jgi:hypothetical protein
MTIWTDLTFGGLKSFVSKHLNDGPPVFWELEQFDKALEARDVRVQIAPDFVAHRRSDSHTLEAVFSPRRLPVLNYALLSNIESQLIGAAEAEDEREFTRSDSQFKSGVWFELDSSIPADSKRSRPIPAVGPGGKITSYDTRRGVTADVTIRRRARTISSTWRTTDDILQPLMSPDFLEVASDLRLQGSFGYFELSKYERQSLMRPVFLFAIESQQDSEGRWPGWQTMLVEPATTDSRIGLREGLGSWTD